MFKLKSCLGLILLFSISIQASWADIASNLALDQAAYVGYEALEKKLDTHEAAKFGAFGTLAVAMRNYFGSYLSIIPKVKLAEQISRLVSISPEIKSVPLDILFKAIETGAFYGASVGLEAIHKYLLETSPGSVGTLWVPSMATVAAWAAVIKLAEGLKSLTNMPGVTELDGEYYYDAPETISIPGVTEFDGEYYYDAPQEFEEEQPTSLFSRLSSRAKQAAGYIYGKGKSFAAHSTRAVGLTGAAAITAGRGMGYLANLKLAEYAVEVANKLPSPKALSIKVGGKNVVVPGKIIKDIAVSALLYGSSYAIKTLDHYMLTNYGMSSELATAAVWASMMLFLDTLRPLVGSAVEKAKTKKDENKGAEQSTTPKKVI